MNKPQDGGPAFPHAVQKLHSSYAVDVPGMTLRDWFAANESLGEWDDQAAIPGEKMCEALAGRPRPAHGWSCKTDEEWVAILRWEAEWRAALKYIRADAMIKAREV